MTREELLASLMVERYTNPWWVTAPAANAVDDDLACARRRRELAADFARLDHPEKRAQ